MDTSTEQTKELSYEEEQLQRIILKEYEDKRIQQERIFRQHQNEEYQEGLQKDIQQNKTFEEISLEEMIRIRLMRFNK